MNLLLTFYYLEGVSLVSPTDAMNGAFCFYQMIGKSLHYILYPPPPPLLTLFQFTDIGVRATTYPHSIGL